MNRDVKRCPYCAEEIQDAAIKCRWCGSDLTVAPDKVVANPPPSLAGTGATSPSAEPARPVATPTQSFPAGSQTGPAATAQPTPSTTQAAGARSPEILSPPRTPSPNANLTFSHESQRYLLGYTPQYYGVWDKSAPGPPVKRFPRTDQGWQQAWEAFIRAEMDVE